MERIKKIFSLVIFTTLTLSVLLSCSGSQIKDDQTTGVYHRVKKGETAYSIARVYNIKLQDLADINGIEDPAILKEGTVLFIPGAKYVIEDVMTYVKAMNGKTDSESTSIEKQKEVALQTVKPEIQHNPTQSLLVPKEETVEKIFIWPVKGTVKAHFGRQPNKTYHNWIKIVAPLGSKVKAAASGTVIFSSKIKDYGKTVIIKHEKNFTTVYTHLNEISVKSDQSVKKGEAIAVVGERDTSGTAYINFEIRVNGKAKNPLLFLP